LTVEWALDDNGKSWLTMSVQIGFVVGALASAIFNLADRMSNRLLMGVSALLGALFNAAIPLLDPVQMWLYCCVFSPVSRSPASIRRGCG
jgi:hypothetical protein